MSGLEIMMALAVAEAIGARRLVAWLRYSDGRPVAPYFVGEWVICAGHVGSARSLGFSGKVPA